MNYRNYNAKRVLPLMAFAAMAFVTSCSNDNLADGSSQSSASGKAQTVELTASLNDDNGTDTRVGMTKEDDNKASFYWHKDEAILVQTVSGGSYSGVKFTTSAETGATTATFTGTVTSGSMGTYAVYPYNESHTFTETTLTYNLPASYNYNKVETNIFSKNGSYPSNSTNMPMLGTISDGGDGNKSISFKHIGGLAVIRIDKMPAASGTLSISASESLAGSFSVALGTSAEMKNTDASNGTNTVTFSFSGATANGVGVFYLPLPTGSYTNVKIVLNSGKVNQTVNYGNLTVSRANVTAIPVVANRVIDNHVFVDLGLSVLWAETNIGANSATESGNYFAWGCTTAGTGISADKYFPTFLYELYPTLYGDVLNTAHDAASKNWGSSCRMPTEEEFEELKDNCTNARTTENGVEGQRITGKNGNSIFLPVAGCQSEDGITGYNNGYYWSSTLYKVQSSDGRYYRAYVLNLNNNSGNLNIWEIQRYIGCSVRPVAKP